MFAGSGLAHTINQLPIGVALSYHVGNWKIFKNHMISFFWAAKHKIASLLFHQFINKYAPVLSIIATTKNINNAITYSYTVKTLCLKFLSFFSLSKRDIYLTASLKHSLQNRCPVSLVCMGSFSNSLQ